MDYGDVMKIDFSLEILAIIAVATKFWDKPNIKKNIEDYFHIKHGKCSMKWPDIVKEVMKEVDLLPFPDILLTRIKNYVPLLGKNLHNWMEYVMSKKGYPVKYVKKVYWTPLGTIDELKIVKELWLKDAELPAPDYHSYLKKLLFSIASIYASEDFIRDNMNQMIEELHNLLPKKQRRRNWTVDDILSTWLVFHSHNSKQDALKVLRDFKKTSDGLNTKSLLLICVKYNYKFAGKYFWNKLTGDEKQHFVLEAANKCFALNGDLKRDKLELLIFLMNQMSDLQITEFLSQRQNFLSLFKTFLQNWPYQRFCLNLLKENLDYEMVPGFMKDLLILVMKYLSCTKKRMKFRNKSIYYNIFQKLLERTTKELKVKHFVNAKKKNFYRLKNLDAASLGLILQDADLKEHKDKLISNFENLLKNCVTKENYEELNALMDNNFSVEQKKLFKEKLNFLKHFIMAGKFKSADNYLNWLYDSENERSACKKNLDSSEICRNFAITYRFDLANEYLEWQLDSKEERKKVKKGLKESVEFLRNETYKIWCSRHRSVDVDSAEQKCLEMLKWYLESDAAVTKFRKTKLIKNKFFIVKYWKNLLHQDSFVDLQKFLEFCLRTPEEIDEIKRNMDDNINWWIDTFILSDLKMINSLLEWIFEYNMKKKVTADYLNSPAGALLCINICKKYSRFRKPIVEFFNSWFGTSLCINNIFHMEMNLELFDKTVATDRIKSVILHLLELRKNGRKIRLSDVKKGMDLHGAKKRITDHDEVHGWSETSESTESTESSEESESSGTSEESESNYRSNDDDDGGGSTVSGSTWSLFDSSDSEEEETNGDSNNSDGNFQPQLATLAARKTATTSNTGRRLRLDEASSDDSDSSSDGNEFARGRQFPLAARKRAPVTNTGRKVRTDGDTSGDNEESDLSRGRQVLAARKTAPITNTGRKLRTDGDTSGDNEESDLSRGRQVLAARKTAPVTNTGRKLRTDGDTSEDNEENNLSRGRQVLAARKTAPVTNTGRRLKTDNNSNEVNAENSLPRGRQFPLVALKLPTASNRGRGRGRTKEQARRGIY